MNVTRKILTLDEFTIQSLRDFPQATGELASLLRDIGLANRVKRLVCSARVCRLNEAAFYDSGHPGSPWMKIRWESDALGFSSQ